MSLHYQRFGTGRVPLLFLHGGWGYDLYPIDAAAAELARRCTAYVPWRSGYGKSPPVEAFANDFHQTAAREMLAFLDAREIERCVAWGHSDGAVIAAWMGLFAPERLTGAVLESFHFDPLKPHSTEFFKRAVETPDALAEATRETLRAEHGDDWHHVVRRNGDVWLRLATAARDGDDLFAGRLGDLHVPALVVHGMDDPRTEPGEIERALEQLPRARACLFETGKHCPHAHGKTQAAVTKAIGTFVEEVAG